ncbi:MAG: hypothetical protein IJ527_02705 [Prevotella sp.]|nr:hypothetical protein [Prevotella sp.]
MKKVFVFALCCIALASCNLGKEKDADIKASQERDSLNQIIAQKDNEINEMMATFNQIEAGFRAISEAEGRVTLNRTGEGSSAQSRIQENMQFIQQTMQQNKALIEKLRQQLKGSSVKSEQLQKTLDNLTKQLETKTQEIDQLRAELAARDIHIAELDEQVTNLNENVSNLTEQNQQRQEVITTQDKELNTAWFVFGTKKELKEQHILDGGEVLKSNFNKDYFTKIDIRQWKEIKLFSRKAEMLTPHPAGSYSLDKDDKDQYVLHILDAQKFWSTSKYLVILVK